MKKLILCLIIFLIASSVSVVFASSGANDFKVPGNFITSNADTSLANYNDKESSYNLHLMISQHDSLDGAKAEMYNPNGSVEGISSFYDSKYGDQGYEEIIEDNGKYYHISVYSTGGYESEDTTVERVSIVRGVRTSNAASNDDSAIEKAYNAIEEFNKLNSVTPVST